MNLPKTALVTGGARRIGRAIALDLAAHGWTVAVHYSRSASEADAVVAEIQKASGAAVARTMKIGPRRGWSVLMDRRAPFTRLQA